jgi:hypothetical protein
MTAEELHGRHVADIVRVVMGEKLYGVMCVESEMRVSRQARPEPFQTAKA